MEKYEFTAGTEEQTKEEIKEEVLQEEEGNKSKVLIDILKNENFAKEEQRKKFVDIITSLFNLKDKEARLFFKKLGQACTEIGSEINKEPESDSMEEKIEEMKKQIKEETIEAKDENKYVFTSPYDSLKDSKEA